MQNVLSFVCMIGRDFIKFSIIHDNTFELIHKKCSKKSYHKRPYDTKYDICVVLSNNEGCFLGGLATPSRSDHIQNHSRYFMSTFEGWVVYLWA